MKSKRIEVNGNDMTIQFYDGCKAYWLDEDGNDTQKENENDEIYYDNAFEADIYINNTFVAYVNDDVYDNNSRYEAVKILMSYDFNELEALAIYNEMADVMGEIAYYRKETFEADQKEEEYQKALANQE